MPDKTKMRYSVELTFDDPETLFIEIASEVNGKPETRKPITSYRSNSVDDAMFDAKFELASLIGLDYL